MKGIKIAFYIAEVVEILAKIGAGLSISSSVILVSINDVEYFLGIVRSYPPILDYAPYLSVLLIVLVQGTHKVKEDIKNVYRKRREQRRIRSGR